MILYLLTLIYIKMSSQICSVMQLKYFLTKEQIQTGRILLAIPHCT